MARRGLSLDLRAALREAVETGKAVERRHVVVETPGRLQTVDLLVEPLGPNATDPLFLVLFRDAPERPSAGEGARARGRDRLRHRARARAARHARAPAGHNRGIRDRRRGAEILQRGIAIDQRGAAVGERGDGDLQEELQSVNEELQTVNSELTGKIDELDRANSDLRNVFDSTQLATVFLDSKLVVRSFTRAATTIFNLIPSDRGRPLTDIVSNLREPVPLRDDIRSYSPPAGQSSGGSAMPSATPIT